MKRPGLHRALSILCAAALACAGESAFAEENTRTTQPTGLPQEQAEQAVVRATAEWEAVKGHRYFWTYEEKAAFYHQYGSEAGDFLLHSGLAMPGKEDLTLEQALEAAHTELKEHFALTEGEICAMALDAAFYQEPSPLLKDEPRVWALCFRSLEVDPEGLPRLLYQVMVGSPGGKTAGRRNFDQQALQELGYSARVAGRLTEVGELFYLPGGGRFFHLNAQCRAVPEQYLPMTGFESDLLGTEPYCGLIPCTYCVQ